jgi:hypothetical protein
MKKSSALKVKEKHSSNNLITRNEEKENPQEPFKKKKSSMPLREVMDAFLYEKKKKVKKEENAESGEIREPKIGSKRTQKPNQPSPVREEKTTEKEKIEEKTKPLMLEKKNSLATNLDNDAKSVFRET